MEKKILIPTSDNKKILGKFRGKSSQPLVIFVHGLSSSLDHPLFYNGSRYFEKKGFAVFRFNLYGNAPELRKMIDSDMNTHVEDLDRVVSYFKKKHFRKIFVVGHSLGGLTILMSKKKEYDGVVLWDASYNPQDNVFSSVRYIKELNGYVYRHEFNVVVSKSMVDGFKGMETTTLTKDIHVPIKIIAAAKGVLVKGAKEYYKYANQPKVLSIIKGASHAFNEDGMQEKLFQDTFDWLKKYKSNHR